MRPWVVVVGVGASVALGATTAGIAGAPRDITPVNPPTLLRLNGIGPLRLGMTRAAAVNTGWLAKPRKGCELAGPPLPVVFKIDGPTVPSNIEGTAEFDGGRLRVLAFSKGVRTRTRVTVGHTSVAQMVHRYRDAGYAASSQYISTFDGRFVTVRHRGRRDAVISAFSRGSSTDHAIRTLAVPNVPVCE